MKTIDKINNLWFGLIPGILLPFIAFIIFWKAGVHTSFGDYISEMAAIHKISSLLSLSVLPNLLLFFVYIWMDRVKAARGVILATLLVGFLMIIMKFIA